MAKAVKEAPAAARSSWWSENKRFLFVLGGVLIFALGINVGNGRLNLGPDGIFRRALDDNKSLPANLSYSEVEEVYDSIRTQYDGKLEREKLLDGLKQGLAEATGDPYTEYFNAAQAEDFNDQLNGTFTGIGAELGKDKDGNIIVIAPIAGFPAEKAGVRAQDIIAAVDDESTAGKSITEVVSKIRGPKDTKVKLSLIRDKSRELTLEITRAEIKVPSVTSEITPDNIGVLKVSRFSEDTARLAREAAENFKQANVRGVVLDLRDDPGGLLDASVDLAGLWLDDGKTVLLEKRDGKVIRTYKASGNPVLKGVKTAVLINEGSASASEITAGAFRDNKVATLIGVKTYGKGSVQQVVDLGNGSQLKVTIAHWFTPKGINIDKQGIEPDTKVERSDEDYANNRDPQKDAAVAQLK